MIWNWCCLVLDTLSLAIIVLWVSGLVPFPWYVIALLAVGGSLGAVSGDLRSIQGDG